MLKNIFIIFIMIIVLGFERCKQNYLNDSRPLSDIVSESGQANLEDDKKITNSVNLENDNSNDILKSELFEEIKNDLDIKIKYPQITNNENIMIEKNNALIKEAAFNKYYEKWNIKGLTLDQSYTVEKRDSELLSIVFRGYVYVAGTAYPTDTCHAVTINLETSERLALSDFIKSYEFLESKIADGKYEVLCGGFKALTSDEILILAHTNFESVKIEENTQKFYIRKDGKICIIIDLPHTGGDYSILCI